MIDAYTIGIKLALEDGVSAGIAVVRRDLAALDRAIAFTAAGMVALRRLGQEVSVVAPSPASPAPNPGSPTHAPLKSQMHGLADPLPSNLLTAAFPGSEPAPEPPTRKTVAPSTLLREAPPRHIEQSDPPEADDAASMPAAERSSISPRLPDQLGPPPRPADSYPVAPKPTLPPKSAAEFAPRMLDRPPRIAAEPPPSPLPSAPIVLPPVGPVAEPVNSPSRSDLVSVPSRMEPGTLHSRASFTPRADLDAVVPRLVANPSIQPRLSPIAPHADKRLVQTFGKVRRERFADTQSHSEGSPRQVRHRSDRDESIQSHASGDITLDGTRLGRWMGDVFARLSERPLSGSIGPDPRVTPSWPAMQGH